MGHISLLLGRLGDFQLDPDTVDLTRWVLGVFAFTQTSVFSDACPGQCSTEHSREDALCRTWCFISVLRPPLLNSSP